MSNSRELLFLSEKFSDIEVRVKSNDGYSWRFPAHSLILSSGSEPLREKIEEIEVYDDAVDGSRKTITIVDMPADAMLLLLRFLYLGELSPLLSTSRLVDLLGASIRFKVQLLQAECEKRILRLLRVSNVCSILEKTTELMASKRGSATIVDACRRVLLDYGHVTFSSDMVLQLSSRNLEYAVASPDLNVTNEKVVLQGVWRWGIQRCCQNSQEITDDNIIDCIADVLTHVRFSSMKESDIPVSIKNRYGPFTKKFCCVFRGNEIHQDPRCSYHLPEDLLHHSSRVFLAAFTEPNSRQLLDMPMLNNRLLCAQASFTTDAFLTALSFELLAEPRSKDPESASTLPKLILSVTAEDTGTEIYREEIHKQQDQGNGFSSKGAGYSTHFVMKFSKPLLIRRHCHYSLHITRQSKITLPTTDQRCCAPTKEGLWLLPSVQVRRNSSPPIDGDTSLTLHCEHVTGVSAVYFLPVAGTAQQN